MEHIENAVRQAAVDLMHSSYAIALTGAGMSTESGLADFRGPRGLWTTDKQAEAKAYQRYDMFLADPKAYWQEMSGVVGTYGEFYKLLREAQPNPGHHALAKLQELGIVKCTITQNVDGLDEKAGSNRVLHYHGTVDKLRCTSCGLRYEVEKFALEDTPPLCGCGRHLKYDVVHFKEPIPADVMHESESETLKCDLMLVCGTSAVVYPFAALPRLLRSAKQGESRARIIEVNAEPTPLTYEGVSDYLIQGKTGEILPAIAEAVSLMR
jgi:NAD-dependent deacetylase